MTTNMISAPLWAGGQSQHVNRIISKGKQRIKLLLSKIKKTKDSGKKEKISMKIIKVNLEVESLLIDTQGNLY